MHENLPAEEVFVFPNMGDGGLAVGAALLAAHAPPRRLPHVYLGPAAPHWEIRAISGDQAFMDGFRDRVHARLLLLPPHDPQFRRNRERVNRDGERERIYIEWDLGYEEEEDTRPPRS